MASMHDEPHPGFRIVADVLAAAECDALLVNLAASDAVRGRAGARHLMALAAVQHVAADPRLLGIARDCLGRAAVPFRATLFAKSTAANWSVVWHQDTALPLHARVVGGEWGPWSEKAGIVYAHAPGWALARVVALRLHLDAATADNGPLRVLPGTHMLGVLADEQVQALARSRPSSDCLVPRGGVMAMSPLLVHSSTRARGLASRRVLHIEYADALALAPGVRLAIA